MWASGQPDRIVISSAGFYVFGAMGQLAAAAGTRRLHQVSVNGGALYAMIELPGNVGVWASASPCGAFLLNANDYVQYVVLQDSGAAVNLTSGVSLWCVRLLAL